jgi:hypothetical protein
MGMRTSNKKTHTRKRRKKRKKKTSGGYGRTSGIQGFDKGAQEKRYTGPSCFKNKNRKRKEEQERQERAVNASARTS